MRIGVPKELLAGETRIAASPSSVTQIRKLGFDVSVESSAGEKANFPDSEFKAVGASIVSRENVWKSELILKFNAPSDEEIKRLREGTILISFIWPAQNEDLVRKLSSKKVSVLAMDSVPRISRAQSMDALSSMANIAGYRAVVEAAHAFGRFFSGQITAAGKILPAKVFVAGAGVAGLAAVGTAGSLGAVVSAFDVRPEVKEQVESMGANFLEIEDKEREDSNDGYAKEMSDSFRKKAECIYAEQARDVDIIITTALIPGKPAPKLITEEMVYSMKPGSVIVDLAASNGGNCCCTVADKVVVTDNGVKVIGYTDMVRYLPTQSSQLYATNLVSLVKLLCKKKDGKIDIDFDDVILRSVTVVRNGEVTWPAPPIKVSENPPKIPAKKVNPLPEKKKQTLSPVKSALLAIPIGIFGWMASFTSSAFLCHFTVFTLACVVGYYVVWNVTHSLHTPLMSVTNAISGIIIVGALLQIKEGRYLVSMLDFIAILIASINIFGGFTVTKRMLEMFHKDYKKE